MQTTTSILILGCGYLGQRVAKQLSKTYTTVYGTTRTELGAVELSHFNVRPLIFEVTQPLTYASLTPALESEALDVIWMIPPGRRTHATPDPVDVMLVGGASILKALRQANVRRAIMVSSTAVYGDRQGGSVSADTVIDGENDVQRGRQRLLYDAEQQWLAAGEQFHVLRLAGLYGPDRVIGQKALQEQSPLLGDPQALLNLIHVDDAASLLQAMLLASELQRIELGSDGHPVPRLAYYNHLAELLGVPTPKILTPIEAGLTLGVDAERLSRTSSKACDPGPTMQRLAWSPAYPNYQQGLQALIKS